MSKVQKCRTYHPLGAWPIIPPGMASVLVGLQVCGIDAGDCLVGGTAELREAHREAGAAMARSLAPLLGR